MVSSSPDKRSGFSRPVAVARPDAAELRLPADRREVGRAGLLFDRGPEETVQVLLAAVSRGDIGALPPLLDGQARTQLQELVERHGADTLSRALKRICRKVCDCQVERILEMPDGSMECRLRVFRLQPGGGISLCYWLVTARRSGEFWEISSFDPLGLIRREA